MLCPRCNREIDEKETLCPYCRSDISVDVEYNDFEKDGFLHIKVKDTDEEGFENTKEKIKKEKYLNLSYLNVVIICFVFLLIVAVLTVFGARFMKYANNDTVADVSVPVYVPKDPTEETTVKIKNEVEDVSIENIYGSWKVKGTKKGDKYAIPYYSFAENGVIQYDHGSFSVTGYFEDYSNEDRNIVYIELEERLNGLFYFNVEGNEKDGYELKLKNFQTGTVEYFETAKAKTYEVKPIDKFKIDKKIIGKWESKDGKKTYEFSEDGKFIRIMGDQMMSGVWTKSDKTTLQLKYMETVVASVYIKYNIYDDVLIINNVMYFKSE